MPTINAVNQALVDYMRVSTCTFHEYYGTHDQFTDKNYDKATVFTIPGNGSGMAEFLTSADGMIFIKHYTDMKHLIEHLRESWQQTNEPVQSFKDAILARWIPLTNNFIQRYGMAMVPYDLHFALTDIRRTLGLHALTWPTIFMLNLDGTIAPSDDVDHIGRVQSLLL